jgi:hypothetical protein
MRSTRATRNAMRLAGDGQRDAADRRARRRDAAGS